MRSGLYHGSKDAVSNVVNGALALLSRENVFGICKPIVFEDLPSLVNYTLLEMVCMLKEVEPGLPVVKALWWLLILDLNPIHACTMEVYHLVASLGDNSYGLNLPQSKTKNFDNTQLNSDK
uniref:PIR2-like helical domain-containing protein n=1 Tax=Solanum lycopersicum TaxID=4081 RepID=A0A3Q7HJH7_SOLLC